MRANISMVLRLKLVSIWFMLSLHVCRRFLKMKWLNCDFEINFAGDGNGNSTFKWEWNCCFSPVPDTKCYIFLIPQKDVDRGHIYKYIERLLMVYFIVKNMPFDLGNWCTQSIFYRFACQLQNVCHLINKINGRDW